TLARLGEALREAGASEAAVALLRRAQQWHPGDFWLNHELAFTLMYSQPPRPREAVRFYTAALALRPRSPGTHLNLGVALSDMGDYAGAIAAFREALRLKPDYAAAHNNLGVALSR